ncbi:MAG: hypothetical protein P8J89_02680 [Phycisphaerales bacterium]|nr:hypothetical protein [Phycisphaerales bacterium]|tara:strand:+ start:1941 stop:2951 length:1011 start_codon:yes stop_codon:yes gene_type:complete
MLLSIAMTSLSLLATGGGETYSSFYAQPDYDRWNYSFNGTAGSRIVGPTFSAYGSGLNFDDRDGQVLLGWVTIDIPSDLPASAYRLKSLSVEITTTSDDMIFDPTLDDRATHEMDGPADPDPGRAVCLSGVGFRNGFDPETFGESGPQPFGAVRGERNAYALSYLEDGTAVDISNNLTDGFDPVFFAVATTDDALPGELLPELGTIRFEIDLNDPQINCYLKESLSFGTLDLMVTSLHPASQPGSGGKGNYPNWIMKDHPLVELGAASAATLHVEVEVIEPSGVSGDANGDGLVTVDDLLEVLGAFGSCPCCPTDFDQDGSVSVDDVLEVISGWTG